MADETRALLQDIIDGSTGNTTPGMVRPTASNYTITFDPQAYKEKLSFYVLRDIICAMSANDTKDIDELIDQCIMKHINDNYDGTCFGYLNNAKNRTNSPLLGSVIQEIEDYTAEAQKKFDQTHEQPKEIDQMTVKEIMDNVENYDTLMEKVGKKTSDEVVDKVVGVITKSKDAPVFDGIDDKLTKKKEDELEKQLAESVIFRIESGIVTEYALRGEQITTKEALERAILEYQLSEMDYLFRQNPKKSIYARYPKR